MLRHRILVVLKSRNRYILKTVYKNFGCTENLGRFNWSVEVVVESEKVGMLSSIKKCRPDLPDALIAKSQQ